MTDHNSVSTIITSPTLHPQENLTPTTPQLLYHHNNGTKLHFDTPPSSSQYPSDKNSIVETRPPALAVEMRTPITSSTISPTLMQHMTSIFDWQYNDTTILEDNGIFTMDDLSTLNYNTFLSWPKTHIGFHMDIEILLQWCIYFNKPLLNFTNSVYDKLMQEHSDFETIQTTFVELQKHVIPPLPNSTPSYPPSPPPLNSPSSRHPSQRHFVTPSPPRPPSHITSHVPILSTSAPDHIRALFDRCTFNDYTIPPPTISDHSSTDKDVSQATASSSVSHHRHHTHHFGKKDHSPEDDSHHQITPPTISYRHDNYSDDGHTCTPSMHDYNRHQSFNLPKIGLDDLFPATHHSFHDDTSTTTNDDHGPPDDTPDAAYNDDHNDGDYHYG